MKNKKEYIVLSLPKFDLEKVKSKIVLSSGTACWLYFGKSYFKRTDLEHRLGHRFRRIDISRFQNEVSCDIRHDYIHWVDELNRRNGKNMEWWFGSISSRNTAISDVFQLCCYLEILDRLWFIKSTRPKLIVVESVELSKVIEKWAEEKNIFVEVLKISFLKRVKIKDYFIIPFIRLAKFVVTLMLRWMVARITRLGCELKDFKTVPSIILDTFVHDYCLSEDGKFNDRYFPYLHEYMSKKRVPVWVHPVLHGFGLNYYSIYQRMRKSKTLFLIQEDVLHFSDYLSAIFFPLRVLRQKIDVIRLRGFDISDIVIEEQRSKSVTMGLQSVLIYRLFLRLGQIGVRPKLIINWYENQNLDRALIIGARKGMPQTRIVATQMYVISSNKLNLFPTQSEVDAKIAPDFLLETSQYQCKRVQAFTKDIPCQPVAALRFDHLFNDVCLRGEGRVQKRDVVLVLLPYDVQEAVELLVTLKKGLEQIKGGINFLIKGHPDYDTKTLVDAFGENEWPQKYEMFNGNVSDALRKAKIVISSNTSSMVEAAVRGIPVVFVGRQTVLNHNYLSDINRELSVECFSSAELITTINMLFNLPHSKIKKFKERGDKLRDLLFTPVNEETMMPFLGNELESS
ncbi:MAG TPA: hypothetical protein ENH85_09980 [Candidatus Scalindua sp.]|nr:hypothetical protein [Candidatus Scalindua sp.]